MASGHHRLATAEPLERSDSPNGERRLMLATLEDGIRTILAARDGRVPHRILRDELEWLTSDDARSPFSFMSLCDFLGFDPHYLRARVLSAY